jgi:GntR family transcriptional repressor for pyruvate dehydrogenase complex
LSLRVRTRAGAEAPLRDAFADLVAAERKRPARAISGDPQITRRSIAERVANRIIAMIKSGNLKAGDQMPTEAQMTVAFAISRPPLREALKALTIMGLLESRQGGRYTVTALSPSRLVAPFNVMLSGVNHDVSQHLEARVVVEVELIRLCTERASAEARHRIMQLAVDGRAFHHDPVAFRLLDIEFHQALYTGACNPLLAALAQGLYDLLLDERRVASRAPGVIEISVQQHIEVAEAVVARDAKAAAQGYRRHLEHVRDTTIRFMTQTRRE